MKYVNAPRSSRRSTDQQRLPGNATALPSHLQLHPSNSQTPSAAAEKPSSCPSATSRREPSSLREDLKKNPKNQENQKKPTPETANQKKTPTNPKKLSSPRHFFRVSREVTPPGSDCATARRRRGARSRPARGARRGGRRSPGGGRAEPVPGWRGGGNAGRGWHRGSCSGVDGSADVRVCVCHVIAESERSRKEPELGEPAAILQCGKEVARQRGETGPRGRLPASGRAATGPKAPPAHTYRHHLGRPAAEGRRRRHRRARLAPGCADI